jgi:hypothetical protein
VAAGVASSSVLPPPASKPPLPPASNKAGRKYRTGGWVAAEGGGGGEDDNGEQVRGEEGGSIRGGRLLGSCQAAWSEVWSEAGVASAQHRSPACPR